MKTLTKHFSINTILGKALIATDRDLVFVIITNEEFEVFTSSKEATEYIKSIRLTSEAA